MILNENRYNLPKGYSLAQTIFNSISFVKNPIKFISKSLLKFTGTYSAVLPGNIKFIITQESDFVNYVLRENHLNYQKSEITSDRIAAFLGKGLLFNNGEEWLKQRRLIQPGFHQKKLQSLYNTVINTTDEFLSTFPTGNDIDVYPLMHKLAFNIVINSLFDIKLSEQTIRKLSDAFSELQKFIMKDINQPFIRFFYPISGEEKKAFKNSAGIRKIISDIIIERKQSSDKEFNDLLNMLLSARYEDTNEPMNDEKIIDEILILIFAGHETTANTLSWLLYLIAGNKNVLQTSVTEVNSISILDSPKSDYLNAVINETMRLYPAAWMTDRVALKDDCYDGFYFPKGTIIITFFFGMHRYKKYWQEETKFLPERFLDENGSLKKMKNYFPFGAGPRMCIGNNFAMAEMAFFMHQFLSKFKITAVNQEPEMIPLITLRPSKVLLNIEKL
jgi:cytochrome P450